MTAAAVDGPGEVDLGLPEWVRPELPGLRALAADPAPDRDWHGDGLCAYDEKPDRWYPEQGTTAKYARWVCRDCPVRLRCLVEGARADERYGVWGGAIPAELAAVRVALGWAGQRPSANDEACANGHPWTDVSSGWGPGGVRRCRECNRIAKRDERRRERAAARLRKRGTVAAVDGRRRPMGTA